MATVVVFVNDKDSELEFLGKALLSLLDRKYFVFTRMASKYPVCPIEKTMDKLREICQHIEDEYVIVSFGCRVLPNNIKEIEALASKQPGNAVFLKRLRGSKTWRIEPDGALLFDNERIADCGIFIVSREDLLKSDHTNFNSFIRHLLTIKKLKPIWVDFWLFSNMDKNKSKKGV
jgi:hypothetical protein